MGAGELQLHAMSEEHNPDLWKALPHRKNLLKGSGGVFEHPPQMALVSFEASTLRVIARLFTIMYAAAYWVFWWLVDLLRRRNSEQNSALRLRKAFQRVGGTFIKLGQQLSLRADLLPYSYCRELSTLLDQIDPFDARHAADAIKDACGRDLDEVFSAFDPNPIGSASIACVFQARLKDGRMVAVKVRRPGIGEVFMADLRALDWLAYTLEFFTILRPGFSAGIRKGIRDTLMEEMDFRREARYQELFRRSAKNKKQRFLTAPRVYPKYSSDKVIVMDLVTGGLKLSELLAAVEQPTNHPQIVSMMRELNIKPRIVAKRLLWANFAGMITDLFFHGDPSPGNIFVQKKSRLMFIDFGSCGSFNQSQRRALKQINFHQSHGDAEGMATASLALLEPLPPIDVDAFSRELESLYQLSLYAMASKHAKWWERTTAVQWYHFLGAALAFNVPLPPVVLRMARATLLYDTVAARLDATIVFYDEYRRFEQYARKLVGKEVRQKIEHQLKKGIDDSHFAVLERIKRTGNRVVYEIERVMDLQPFKFVSDIRKGVYVVLSLVRMVFVGACVTVVTLTAGVLVRAVQRKAVWDLEFLRHALQSPWYWAAIGLIVVHTIRSILYRLRDKDSY